MSTNKVVKHYDKEWKDRLKKSKNEKFNHYERNWVLPQLFKNNERVLDLASGNSIVGNYLKKEYSCQVTALDFSKKAIKAAKEKGIRGMIGSVEEKLPFKSNSFDMVFWGDNIEHIWAPDETLKEIHRILKLKGRVIISTPNQGYWRYRLYMFFNGAIPKTEGAPNKPWRFTHIRFFNRKILKKLLAQEGFKERKFLGVSRRRIDKPFVEKLPELFGMIMVVEAEKK